MIRPFEQGRLFPSFLTESVKPGTYEVSANSETGVKRGGHSAHQYLRLWEKGGLSAQHASTSPMGGW